MIVIAHKLPIIAAADSIVFLEGGRELQKGRHVELLNRCEAYRKL